MTNEIKLTPKQTKALDSLGYTSSKIRYIRKEYPEISQYRISKLLNIRPQHVNNVLRNPVKSPKENI